MQPRNVAILQPRNVAILILQDGETYSGVDQCSICVITNEEADKLADGEITCGDLNPIAEFMLKEIFSP